MNDTFVEDHKMRTWQTSEAPAERRRWQLVAKAQFMRFRYNWVFWILVAGGILLALDGLVGSFAAMYGGGIDGDYLPFGYLFPALWLIGASLLLLVAPAIAEDLRFDAPLFYFSRPLTVKDYLIGKVFFVVGLLLLLVLPGAVLSAVVGMGTWAAPGPEAPEPPQAGQNWYTQEDYQRDLFYYETQRLPNWQATHMDSFGDWLFTYAILLVGLIVSIVFLASLALFLSSYTARGWHAAVAIVVALVSMAMIGTTLGDVLLTERSSLQLVFSPTLWPYLATSLPIEAFYQYPDSTYSMYKNTGASALLATIFMVASSAGLLSLTHRRLKTIGGAL